MGLGFKWGQKPSGTLLVSWLFLLSFFSTLVCFQWNLYELRGLLIDAIYRLKPSEMADPGIALLAYDDESALPYGRTTEIPSQALKEVFESLSQSNAQSVLYLGNLNKEHYSPEELEILSGAITGVKKLYIGYLQEDPLPTHSLPEWGKKTPYLPGFISRDYLSFGADSVCRRILVSLEGTPSVFSVVASKLNPSFNFESGRFFSMGDSVQSFIHWQGGPNTYPSIPFHKVRSLPLDYFKEKTVIVGSARLSRKEKDFIKTPFSRDLENTSVLEAAAQGLVSLSRENGLVLLPRWIDWSFSFLVSFLISVGATFFSPLTGFFIYSGSLLLVTLFSGASLHFFSFWIDPSHFFVIATVIYYLVIPYRLVLEYQRRAHFQEKSIWMTKAEEAKRNFFSLVSHDLKTPISRIQGAAELLLQKIEPHQASEKKSLDAILETTASLNDYVEAVFDLARLESSNAPLQKTSRDLNSVIKEVIDNKEYLASEKEIQLHSIQEPLFSVDMDVKLIKRAIANVLENAIKYSPRGSLISLKSGESKGYVFVSIQDQGIGINPEEQEKVFERFYRGKQVKDSPTKGTGLGLYLVKYFVELHKGVVELKSRPEVGSTFTIFLPV